MKFKRISSTFLQCSAFVIGIFSLGIACDTAYAEPGTYEVPVTDPLLKPFSVMDTGSVSYRISNRGLVRIGYNLPADIAGEPKVRNSLRGTASADGTIHLSSEISDAFCEISQENEMSCFIQFKDTFKIEPEVIAPQIAARYPDQPQDVAKREQVMRAFGFDAIGILKFKIRQ